jgi:hypothetical protein
LFEDVEGELESLRRRGFRKAHKVVLMDANGPDDAGEYDRELKLAAQAFMTSSASDSRPRAARSPLGSMFWPRNVLKCKGLVSRPDISWQRWNSGIKDQVECMQLIALVRFDFFISSRCLKLYLHMQTRRKLWSGLAQISISRCYHCHSLL